MDRFNCSELIKYNFELFLHIYRKIFLFFSRTFCFMVNFIAFLKKNIQMKGIKEIKKKIIQKCFSIKHLNQTSSENEKCYLFLAWYDTA